MRRIPVKALLAAASLAAVATVVTAGPASASVNRQDARHVSASGSCDEFVADLPIAPSDSDVYVALCQEMGQ
ncbi:hypothetical protein DY245_06365 [Streptomyces inhibens]|uniref:Uncharacterized protein n=1 Tax=Streptomyces inhibens TaxID=2293571 RepID=A0A371Q8R7_STRIH|nr:hypothetical protein DY245_06365 [Streptomyces inhibens]